MIAWRFARRSTKDSRETRSAAKFQRLSLGAIDRRSIQRFEKIAGSLEPVRPEACLSGSLDVFTLVIDKKASRRARMRGRDRSKKHLSVGLCDSQFP